MADDEFMQWINIRLEQYSHLEGFLALDDILDKAMKDDPRGDNTIKLKAIMRR